MTFKKFTKRSCFSLQDSPDVLIYEWILFSFGCSENPNCTEQPIPLRIAVFKVSLGYGRTQSSASSGYQTPRPFSKFFEDFSVLFSILKGLRFGFKGTFRWIVVSKECIMEVINAVDRQTVGNSTKGPLRKVQSPAPETAVLEKWNQNPSSRSEGLMVFLEGAVYIRAQVSCQADSCVGSRGMDRKWGMWPPVLYSI